MATLRYFPGGLLKEGVVSFDLMGQTVTGGQTGSGLMPMSRLDGGGLWKATLAEIPVISADQVRAWRALAAICDGGVQPIIVPMCDRRYFPAPTVDGELLYSLGQVPHDDDAFFDDDTGYVSDVVEISLRDAAVLRATSLTVNLVAGGELMGGEHFSIDHENLRHRLYRIRTAVDNGDGSWAITIRPPLRAAVAADTPLQFDQPKCVMRIASPDGMDLSLKMRRYGMPSVSFIEAFPPFPE